MAVLNTALIPAVTTWVFDVSGQLDGVPIDPAEISERAKNILADPKYAGDTPTLLERLLGPVYDWLEWMIAFVTEMLTRVLQFLAGLFTTDVMTLVGPILVLLSAVAAAFILARRRARDIQRRETIERILELGSDPTELEALAAAAEDAGDFSEAIRLRFVAGLLRLDVSGVIDFYPGLPNGAISEKLGDPTFSRLANQFDEVVYGQRTASKAGAERATADWSSLQGALV